MKVRFVMRIKPPSHWALVILLVVGGSGIIVGCTPRSPGVEVILTPRVAQSVTPPATGDTQASQVILTLLPPTPGPLATPTVTRIAVHVNGAVARPGVYTFTEGSRVVDALTAAGGLLPAADLDQLNQAALLRDAQLLYVPFRGTPAPVALPPANAPPSAAKSSPSATPSGPINLNTATKAELETLPGIGPALADRIIEHRQKIGRFQRPEDLKNVPGIGDRTFENLKSRIMAP